MGEDNVELSQDAETQSDTAALLMAFGGPHCVDDVGPFMRNLMGTDPPQQLVERVQKRYLAIGGCSPLPGIATEMASAVEQSVSDSGHQIPVAIGMRYWTPGIPEVLTGMYQYGIRRVIAVSLSPLESRVATGAYREAIDETLAHLPGMEIIEAPHLIELPAFGSLLVAGAAEALTEIKDVKPSLAVFTAHSLPLADVDEDDTYVTVLRATVDSIVEMLQMAPGAEIVDDERLPGVSAYGCLDDPQPWLLAYQSKGNRPGGWLGPDLDDVIEAAGAAAFRAIAFCPVGFATDHMETLYDLDVVAASNAVDQDMEYSRAPVPNAHALLIEALAETIINLSRAPRGGETGQGAHTDTES